MKHEIVKAGHPTIKNLTDKICQCGGRIAVIYAKGYLADWCDGCGREERHERLENSKFEMPFGKHAGRTIDTLPSEYMLWFIKNVGKKSLVARMKEELKKRNVSYS